MILADTSIWISFLRKDDQDLFDIVKLYLKKNEIYSVSAVFGELFQGVRNKREYETIHSIYSDLPKAYEQDLFIEAGKLSSKAKLLSKGVGLIDSYIITACLKNNLSLWTLDKKLNQAYEEIVNS